MSLLKKAVGNMYQFVTHVCSPIVGCYHRCSYCYYTQILKKYGRRPPAEPKFLKKAWYKTDMGRNNTIFITHLSDMFAEQIPRDWIKEILFWCAKEQPYNTYLFQSKNPLRYMHFIEQFPLHSVIGTTIETDLPIDEKIRCNAPSIRDREMGMVALKQDLDMLKYPETPKTFISIEPIMKFTLTGMMNIINNIRPNFIVLGADSKNCRLPEPTKEETIDLINEINLKKIQYYIKDNLRRLIK